MALSYLRMDSARRRLKVLSNILRTPAKIQARLCSNSESVTIGDVTIARRTPKNPELVPTNYVKGELPQYVIRHLRWMAQKDLLGQDIFLIGPPGPFRRTLAMQYLELLNRETEYVSLSRDTTESDLKQRREIENGTAYYVDQCAVKAAVHGRVLVIDGIEKAERNVLPVLNNLLENREMQLEDGRFLMAAARYDKLLETHSKEELKGWNLVRASDDFRVIALGLPIPKYRGHPLDPPLRSRFQGRDINRLPFHEYTRLLQTNSTVSEEAINKILSFAYMFVSGEAETLGLPDFPLEGLQSLLPLLQNLPHLPPVELLYRVYPYNLFASKEGTTAVKDALKKFGQADANLANKIGELVSDSKSSSYYNLVEVTHDEAGVSPAATVTLQAASLLGSKSQLKVLAGTRGARGSAKSSDFVSTPTHQSLLTQMIQSHLVRDFCIVGPKGSGKSVVVKEFARILGYDIEPFVLYRDVTSRDLLQQRATLENGDTVWRSSPMVTAALEGKLLVLDGLHRVDGGTLAVLHRLVHERELQLYDGTRLVSSESYENLKQAQGLTDADMASRGIWKIHPSFRLIALAEPQDVSGTGAGKKWLDAELLTMFFYHHLRPLPMEEETFVLSQLGIGGSKKIETILNLAHVLRNSTDPAVQSLSSSLSTRQLIRLGRRLQAHPEDSVSSLVQNACLARFLPPLTKTAFDSVLSDLGIVSLADGSEFVSEISAQSDLAITCEVKDNVVRIGKTTVPLHNPTSPSKVPDILFYDIPQHLEVMENMLKDFLLGEQLLLIGNQGVGKNKIVDRFLQLLNRPREYVQLHRDTTVQTLTLQPTVLDGRIVYEDSPLVRALRFGHVLVVDEADKAPAHVVCVLKTLLESGEMLLSDGRRVVKSHDVGTPRESNSHLIMHPDFRMIILANRPGFPFLGNDFFGSLGDIFACHPVDNPDFASELSMLKQYGPDVPDSVLTKLIRAFGELRNMSDTGLVAYPYSTREAVNIIRHLQTFPGDSLTHAVRNVFDFDSYAKETVETLTKVLQKHGIPVGVSKPQIHLATEFKLPEMKLSSKWRIDVPNSPAGGIKVERRPIAVKETYMAPYNVLPLAQVDHRSSHFSELHYSWKLPLHYTNMVSDLCTNKFADVADSSLIFAVTANPVQLYTFGVNTSPTVTCLDLKEYFPAVKRGGFKSRIRMTTLGDCPEIFLMDEMSGTKLLVHPTEGRVHFVEPQSDLIEAAEEFMRRIGGNREQFYHLSSHFANSHQWLLSHQPNSETFEAIDVKNLTSTLFTCPFKVTSIYPLSTTSLLLSTAEDRNLLMSIPPDNQIPTLRELLPEVGTVSDIDDLFPHPVPAEVATLVVGADAGGKAVLPLSRSSSFADFVVGLSSESNQTDIYGIDRPKSDSYSYTSPDGPDLEPTVGVVPSDGLFLRTRHHANVSREANPQGHEKSFLEIVDTCRGNARYVPIDNPITVSPYAPWLTSRTETGTYLCPTRDGGAVVVADLGGTVRFFDIGTSRIARQLEDWQRMIGDKEMKHMQLTVQRDNSKSVNQPKFGKMDRNNAPHVGGNTWAGGTGGRDTAGLGGMGGPFRLDAGHTVFQVSDADKAAVPEEVRKAAREMARKAHQERLREIKMSEFDAHEYEKFSSSVRQNVRLIRVMLDGLQAKGKERQWLHHQTTGELDDIKIIEGLTGERNIYKRRGEQDPEPGSPQQLAKRVKLLVDVSGSMYRFNGYDGRLERVVEAALMVMEAFDNYEHKFKYEIIGHSGDDHNVKFVSGKNVPKNNKDRMDVLKMMYAHAQFCSSGDNTLEATDHAIKTIVEEEKADEYFVIALSDANFDRYGIPPRLFARLLTADPRVNAYSIFIGSLGDQAQRLKEALPAGRAFVCLETSDIPKALHQIFTSSILNVGGGDTS